MVAHLLACPFHTVVERCSSSGVTRWKWLIQSLFFFVVISIFLLFVLRGGRDRDVAVGHGARFTHSGYVWSAKRTTYIIITKTKELETVNTWRHTPR
jgi:hypothetical protein